MGAGHGSGPGLCRGSGRGSWRGHGPPKGSSWQPNAAGPAQKRLQSYGKASHWGGQSYRHGVQKVEGPEARMPQVHGKMRGLFWRGQNPFRKESEPALDSPWTRHPCPWNPIPSLGHKGKLRLVQRARQQGLQPGLEPRRRASPPCPGAGVLEGLLTSVGATPLPNSPSLTLVLTHDWTWLTLPLGNPPDPPRLLSERQVAKSTVEEGSANREKEISPSHVPHPWSDCLRLTRGTQSPALLPPPTLAPGGRNPKHSEGCPTHVWGP